MSAAPHAVSRVRGGKPGPAKPVIVVVFGVSASGKSTLGMALAEQLDCAFEDGDDLHPVANIRKMISGKPLDDADRAPWLDRVADWIADRVRAGEDGVIACSALKHAYRDRLRKAYADTAFVLLAPSATVLRKRIRARKGHFMPPALLASQLRTLEPPDASERALTIGNVELEDACLQALAWLAYIETAPNKD